MRASAFWAGDAIAMPPSAGPAPPSGQLARQRSTFTSRDVSLGRGRSVQERSPGCGRHRAGACTASARSTPSPPISDGPPAGLGTPPRVRRRGAVGLLHLHPLRRGVRYGCYASRRGASPGTAGRAAGRHGRPPPRGGAGPNG